MCLEILGNELKPLKQAEADGDLLPQVHVCAAPPPPSPHQPILLHYCHVCDASDKLLHVVQSCICHSTDIGDMHAFCTTVCIL